MKRYCPRGHDTQATGRDDKHRCNECNREAHPRDAWRRFVERRSKRKARTAADIERIAKLWQESV